MGVLHGLADRDKQLQSLARAQIALVAILGDRHARNQLHHEIRPTMLRRSRIEDLGDVGMVHHRQRLPLRLKARDHLPRVHSRLDDF